MPSQMSSSFASAAAGQASNRDSRGVGRGDARGSGDWPRRENRGPNGTLTLRRSSTTPHAAASSTASSQPDMSPSLAGLDSSVGQSQQYSNQIQESVAGGRYSKIDLLEIFRAQNAELSRGDASRLFVNNWDPGHSHANTTRGWGKSADTRDHSHGPEVCWDANGDVQPIGLEEMSPLEQSLFASDVNSPLKPPPQNTNKDPNAPGAVANGRKPPLAHAQSAVGNFGLNSPTSGRPGTRRRETSDTVQSSSLASPGVGNRFNRDEQSPFFNRKTADGKEFLHGTVEDRGEDAHPGNGVPKEATAFGTAVRSGTAGYALGNGSASPWGTTPSSAALAPMGNFGSFSVPNPTQPTTPSEKRPGFGSIRGESRLAHLMPKESSEDLSSKPLDSARTQDNARPWRSRPRTDTDPFGDEPVHSGSAVLGGLDDLPSSDASTRQISHDFGMSDLPGFRDRREQSQQTPNRDDSNEPLSPTETNPYNSSPPDRNERDVDEGNTDHDNQQRSHALGGIPEHTANSIGGLPRGFGGSGFEGSDRSQTSSVGASKGFPSLGGLSGLSGLGGLSGWPTSAHPMGTPDRERSGFQGAFGNSLFSPLGDLQSPSLSGLGGGFGPGSSTSLSGANAAGRSSKLGSLFPTSMQAQMHGTENEVIGDFGQGGFGAIGRNAFASGPSRDTDSPMRGARGAFEDIFQGSEGRNQVGLGSAEGAAGPGAPTSQAPPPPGTYQQSQASSDSASGLPQTQQRTMVMPDRMRWVYLDPQGQTQGPWSGLEMHDWYKASFFTADLSVKKVEDAEFEPLGQLIRRIGNSREPFLVPQIGVPHGPPTTQPGAPFAPSAVASGSAATPSGAVQPPFAGAFPSFGTTLTAEQQNNLERRKQEEQYLMARQREFLAQQQVNMKQIQQMQTSLPSALHHHSSAHSLQSQPSFGSITSPIGMPPGGQLPGSSGFFDAARQPMSTGGMGLPPDFFREDELARLSLQDRQQSFGPGMVSQSSQAQQLPGIFSQQPGPQREMTRNEQSGQHDVRGSNPRLREFEQLRAQHDLEQKIQAQSGTTNESASLSQQHQPSQSLGDAASAETNDAPYKREEEALSLTEQVQKAASAKQTPVTQPESPWAKVGSGLPMPFPPPQSTTPLPAPLAQRGRTDLAETLNMGTRSRSGTPDKSATPSIAPWAKEPTEASKGPSLKEIQEAEAKKAAKLEEAALAARRAAAEQELRSQPAPSAAPAPGLPTTATWGSAASPSVPTNAAPAWAKPAVSTATSSGTSAAQSQKTLADIQREDELRKQKLAAATIVTASPGQSTGGKRYADLASKQSTSPAAGGAWSTVGSGGKAKAPGITTATSTVTTRAASSSVPAVTAVKTIRSVTSTTRSTTVGSTLPAQSGVSAANQEFLKWAKNALAKGLNSDINVDNFVDLLSGFPAEASIIADSVYANSQLMDGRRFAEEFIRRRKLAEKGIVESAGTGTGFSTVGEPKSTGGWSEVAKKGPPKEEPTAGFKVVPNKKKGRK